VILSKKTDQNKLVILMPAILFVSKMQIDILKMKWIHWPVKECQKQAKSLNEKRYKTGIIKNTSLGIKMNAFYFNSILANMGSSSASVPIDFLGATANR